jgi:hypothetical protein
MLVARSDSFRKHAAECCAAAQTAKDSAIKQAYVELAQGWRLLADQIDSFASQGSAARRKRAPRRAPASQGELSDNEADRLRASHGGLRRFRG